MRGRDIGFENFFGSCWELALVDRAVGCGSGLIDGMFVMQLEQSSPAAKLGIGGLITCLGFGGVGVVGLNRTL